VEEHDNVSRIKAQDLKRTQKTTENKLHKNSNNCFSLIQALRSE